MPLKRKWTSMTDKLYGAALALFVTLLAATKWCERGGSLAVYMAVAGVIVVSMIVVAHRIDAEIRRQIRQDREERRQGIEQTARHDA